MHMITLHRADRNSYGDLVRNALNQPTNGRKLMLNTEHIVSLAESGDSTTTMVGITNQPPVEVIGSLDMIHAMCFPMMMTFESPAATAEDLTRLRALLAESQTQPARTTILPTSYATTAFPSTPVNSSQAALEARRAQQSAMASHMAATTPPRTASDLRASDRRLFEQLGLAIPSDPPTVPDRPAQVRPPVMPPRERVVELE